MRADTCDFKTVEEKWQKIWEEKKIFEVPALPKDKNKKFYCLVMFPYPSGKIHMGHARNYCIGDIIARFKRMQGFEVLHPIGWDAFGLPAENAAIQHKINPGKWTKQNIKDMREDIKSLGISYDWKREFATCDPEYYHWNQWFFLQMYKKGLAYRKKSAVNWCPKCETVLANEQVHEGKCWRCSSVVTQKELDQWFFKITAYAEQILNDLKTLQGGWPDEVITMQRNWIGKSIGAEVDFEVINEEKKKIRVFTTRPDTLFGCTFMVLSPEYPGVESLLGEKEKSAALKYIEQAKSKTRAERTAPQKDKTGVFTGSYAKNPINGAKTPIWIADYVVSGYGTGAVMSVPAHDQRDFEFAKKFKLPIIEVIQPKNKKDSHFPDEAFEDEGTLIQSGEFNGLNSKQAAQKITKKLEQDKAGQQSVNFRIRDWLISRQRYWGTPIPMLYCKKCGIVPVPEKDLPVILPENVEFTGKGESPLKQVKEFVNTKCPQCRGPATRETDSMDTFVDSSWYFLRYVDAKNSKEAFEKKTANAWLPVDQYVGGIEHACMHLIYSRFFHKVIRDLGMVESQEPFSHLLTQGMVTLGGSVMSKSKGNAVPVEDMVKEYGADTARLFVMFASPPRNQLEWSDEGVHGSWRFLNRIFRLGKNFAKSEPNKKTDLAHKEAGVVLQRKTHQTIKKVDEDIKKDFQFNTAIAALMELLNRLSDYPNLGDDLSRESYRSLLLLLYPFAPHLSSDLWEECGYEPKDLYQVPYPTYREDLIQESTAVIIVQVNGKLKNKLNVPAQDSKVENKILPMAKKSLAEKGIKAFQSEAGNSIKYKFVPGRLVNFIVDQASGVEVSK